MIRQMVLSVAALAAAAAMGGADSHWNGGRNVPVHKLAPLDVNGDAVSPGAPSARPISTLKTCSQCHDVASMKGASHFRTGCEQGEAPESVRTEPWFLIDGFGSQIPLSLHSQSGAWSPAAIGMSAWQWTKQFGRHFPGGGVGIERTESAEKSRWFVTGSLEPNCFACHSTDGKYDSSEWARQTLRENFEGAATAALGIAEVGGMNSRLDGAWDVMRGPNRDDKVFEVQMNVKYDLSRFDDKGRTVLPIGRPKSENCLACHSATPKGMGASEIAGDVHLKAGLSCTDCHKNGMDHRIATTSCAECHTAGDKAGKLSGPRPGHIGIPLVHFEKLSCTVCHSGVVKQGEMGEVRSARANRIGVYGRAQWATEAPYAIEPVYFRNEEGKIEPRRAMWPSFFAKPGADGKLVPITTDELLAATADSLTVVKRVEDVLAALNSNPNRPGDAVLVEKGIFFRTEQGDVPLYLPSKPVPAGADEKTADAIKGENDTLMAQFSAVLQSLVSKLPPSCRDLACAKRDGKMFVYRFQKLEGKDTSKDYKDGTDTTVPADDMKSMPADGDLEIGYFKNGNDEYVPLLDKYTRTEYLKLAASPGKTLTSAMIASALGKLGADARYVGHGKVFKLDGGLLAVDGEADGAIAAAVTWPVSHDVRRAGQALGAPPVKCADCHSADSKFFFGSVAATGPVADPPQFEEFENSLSMEACPCYHRVLGFTFLMRPMFKAFLWTVFGLMCLVLVATAGWALSKLFEKVPAPKGFGFFCTVCLDLLLAGATACLALTGAIGWFGPGMTSWLLMLHMVAGGGLAVALLTLSVIRFARNGGGFPLLWTLFVALGTVVVFTAVMPMMTVFGSSGQEFLLQAHRFSALAFAVVSLLACVRALKLKK